ncbi:unnamed protein product [Gongylonema pulchrum]|uniref:RNA helicase n=1 Tax=Gongylonema pulchrum TaxID=637853 RepID=A0A183E8V5_9BILA|nr:unnamed protein product [Gongylonema pulchrum]
MSATLETDALSEYFDNAPVFFVQGRTYPVQVFYANSLDKKDDDYLFNVIATVLQIHRTEPMRSDVLAFLTGQEEIETACKKIEEASKLVTGNIVALPLYANLPPITQMRGTRRVIFATNIAETSLTIPGIRIVVDSGKVKTNSKVEARNFLFHKAEAVGVGRTGSILPIASTSWRGLSDYLFHSRLKNRTYHPDRGIDVLRVEDVSQSSAMQRAGRAGRESPGKCFRVYSEKHFFSLPKNTTPEILRSNLSTVMLFAN